MTFSRSDRPYGSFPGPGKPAPAPEVPPIVPPLPLRVRIWRRVAAPLALAAMLVLSWQLVDAVKTGAITSLESAQEQPTPAPTPPLAAAVYAQVAPSVVQVTGTTSGSEPASGAGVIVDEQGDILTSLHIVNGTTRITVRFADGTESRAEIIGTLPDKDIAVLHPQTPPAKVVAATMGDPSRLAIGSPAFVMVHPSGLTSSLSAGRGACPERWLASPGLAKPLAVKTVAQAISGEFRRIQFTPDLAPADLVGTRIYNQKTGDFQTSLGPVFTNLLLADEINRAPAKVQSALLEVMQERQVTIGRETHRVPDPFLVMATQNPIETEGTYALP